MTNEVQRILAVLTWGPFKGLSRKQGFGDTEVKNGLSILRALKL